VALVVDQSDGSADRCRSADVAESALRWWGDQLHDGCACCRRRRQPGAP